MIRALDARLIAAHQWVVDLTQRQPAWLARQCATLCAVAACVRWAIFESSPWATGLLLLICGAMAVTTHVPALFASFGAAINTRLFVLVTFSCMDVLVLLLILAASQPNMAGRFIAASVPDLCLLAFYYFAACHPPRPRVPRPRGRLAHGGAA